MPTFLIPMTDEARLAAQSDRIEITRFPFRIGRESRVAVVNGELRLMERRKKNSEPNNDLYIIDKGPRLNISREHLQIERAGNSSYRVFDRGSACGTIVDGEVVGGADATGAAPVRHASVIIIGSGESPFRFRFECD